MAMSAENRLSGIPGRIWEDLLPFPGRLQLTWQVAFVCAISAAISMTYRVPEAAISLYLVIFLMKRDALNNCAMAIGLILLATLVVAGMIPLTNMTVESPAMRLMIIFGASFVFLYLSSATSLGEQAAIIGLIIAFIMTLVTMVPAGEIADQGLMMAWKMVAVPMVVMFVFSFFAGPSPHRLVREKLVERLRRAADQLGERELSPDLLELLGEGNKEQLQRMKLAGILRLAPKPETLWLTGAIETSYRILMAVTDQTSSLRGGQVDELKRAMIAAADRIEKGGIQPSIELHIAEGARALSLCGLLESLSRPDGGGQPEFAPPPLLFEDAFSNPDHQRFALKTAAAATICYLIYTGIQWNGIHTAMITCYVASLGSVGETVHKLLLRIGGCLIGAGIGVAALFLVMPHLTSIGGLMALVFGGVFIGAWVSSGNERINYAGVQIALAFLLTVLNDFGPSFEFSQASNRIVGILVGNLVVYLVFTQIWPKSVFHNVKNNVSIAVEHLEGITANAPPNHRIQAVSRANAALFEADNQMRTIHFEPAKIKPSEIVLSDLSRAISQLRDLSISLGADSISLEDARTALRTLINFLPTHPNPSRTSMTGSETRTQLSITE